MKHKPHNFARPGRVDGGLEQALERWFRAACALAPRKWEGQMAFRAEMALGGLDALAREEALASIPEESVVHALAIGKGAIPSLFAAPRTLILTLVGGLLGDTEGKLPSDRALTTTEETLWEYLLQDCLLPTLQETWPGPGTQTLELKQKEPNPKWTRILPASERLAAVTFAFRGPFGEEHAHWLVPRKPLTDALAIASTGDSATKQQMPRPLLEAHVRGMSLAVSVTLGATELPLSQIARLQAGDVVILNQKVTDALPARVEGKDMLRVWCGRVGPRQAIQVESILGR